MFNTQEESPHEEKATEEKRREEPREPRQPDEPEEPKEPKRTRRTGRTGENRKNREKREPKRRGTEEKATNMLTKRDEKEDSHNVNDGETELVQFNILNRKYIWIMNIILIKTKY